MLGVLLWDRIVVRSSVVFARKWKKNGRDGMTVGEIRENMEKLCALGDEFQLCEKELGSVGS